MACKASKHDDDACKDKAPDKAVMAHLLDLRAVGLLGQAGVHAGDLGRAQPQQVAQLRQARKLAAVPLHHHCGTAARTSIASALDAESQMRRCSSRELQADPLAASPHHLNTT